MLKLQNSWTVKFFRENCRFMTPLSAVRLWRFYRAIVKQGTPPTSTLKLTLRKRVEGTVSVRTTGSDMATFKEIVVQGVYDSVPAVLPRCEYIIDLGANIGLASLYFATQYPTANVLAIEPDSDNYSMLKQNLSTCERCSSRRLAVWSRNTSLATDRSHGEDRFSSIRVAPSDQGGANAVPGATLRSIFTESGFPRIDLLKVDIEGAETELLSDSDDWLPLVNAIAIEFHDETRKESRFDELVSQAGFTIVHESSHTVLAVRHQYLKK
ncbi:FkbM family methyltransferase [Roseiconus lacunae]|uniref:FkbM family methyltransferase n=1 Tax=Roseiconus lacunae TaxID=2605694 RepID=A0ABT7PQR3_9BACT|nr:FkbM family methyltransferase [Roseiconus lacunae]MDM4018854.1 FkbM family methyltransferase [Roseiconus lacunae]